jgi:small-conductance mechanosensitive channel
MPAFELTLDSLIALGLPVGFILAGIFLGWLFERVVLRRLEKLSKKTKTNWDDVAVGAVRHAPTLWFTALGAWLATRTLPLSDTLREILERGLSVLIIISVTLVVARAASGWVESYSSQGRASTAGGTLITTLTRMVIFVLGTLFVLQSLGIPITPLITGLGIGGLAVALALQPTLANTFAGVQIIASGQIRKHDYIRLETGEEGHVTDIKWRNTTIKALWDDHEVVVPNSRLGDSVVVNYSLPSRPYWVRIELGVHYDSDLEQVERVVSEVARESAEACGSSSEQANPVMRFQNFGDSSIDFFVRIRVDRYEMQYKLRHEFIKRLHVRFNEEGIEIPFPIRTVYVPNPVSVSDTPA